MVSSISSLVLLCASPIAAWSLQAGRLALPRSGHAQVQPLTTYMSASFLAEAAAAAGATTTSSGLVYEELVAGTGASPSLESMVKVDYTGKLADGSIFDSSVARGEPAEFPLNKVIKGWQEGVAMMKEGGKARLTIPAEIAYGANARPGIPANSVLQFEIELLEVTQAAAPIPDDYIGKSFSSFSIGKKDKDAPDKPLFGEGFVVGIGACGLIGVLAYTGILPQ